MAPNNTNIFQIIADLVDAYLRSLIDTPDETKKYAVLGNIATSTLAGGDNTDLNNTVVVSLVNIEEEASLRNQPYNQQGHQLHKQYPPVFINIYLLFTANFDHTDYTKALSRILKVIEFFQANREIEIYSIQKGESELELENDDTGITLEMDLHTLSFEQLNNLWGSLGGKQLPFVLYRARLLEIKTEKPISRTSFIKEIDAKTQLIN